MLMTSNNKDPVFSFGLIHKVDDIRDSVVVKHSGVLEAKCDVIYVLIPKRNAFVKLIK